MRIKDREKRLVAPTFNLPEELWNISKAKSFERRVAGTLSFLELPLKGPILDLGVDNALKGFISRELDVEIVSCEDVDFDYDPIPGIWGTILCFEVLEHLFNPLFCLENMKRSLLDEGSIYISTPGQMKLLWDYRHYHEIDDKRLRWLFDRAKLSVVKKGKASMRGAWWQHICGVRPILRTFQYTRLFQLKMVGENGKTTCFGSDTELQR